MGGHRLVGIDLDRLDLDATQGGAPAQDQQIAAVTVGAEQVRVDPDDPELAVAAGGSAAPRSGRGRRAVAVGRAGLAGPGSPVAVELAAMPVHARAGNGVRSRPGRRRCGGQHLVGSLVACRHRGAQQRQGADGQGSGQRPDRPATRRVPRAGSALGLVGAGRRARPESGPASSAIASAAPSSEVRPDACRPLLRTARPDAGPAGLPDAGLPALMPGSRPCQAA